MKFFNKLVKLSAVGVLGITCLTGCFKGDSMEGIDIVTTKYPITYAIDMLYGDYSNITSVYPNGVDVDEYKITDKKAKQYSKSNMLIYNGLSKEGDLAITFLDNNKNIKLIDVSKGLCIKNKESKDCSIYSEDEIWINPGNYLMVTQNIKNDLESYINSTVILKDIDEKFEDLKLIISTFDAELKMVKENASDSQIVITNNAFKFLESKYGYKVYSIDEKSDEYTSADYNKALSEVKNKNIKYVFMLEGDEETEKVKNLVSNGATIVTINSLANLDDEEINTGVNYKSIMENFIELLKQEVY